VRKFGIGNNMNCEFKTLIDTEKFSGGYRAAELLVSNELYRLMEEGSDFGLFCRNINSGRLLIERDLYPLRVMCYAVLVGDMSDYCGEAVQQLIIREAEKLGVKPWENIGHTPKLNVLTCMTQLPKLIEAVDIRVGGI